MKPIIAVPAIAALVYRAYSHKSLTPAGITAALLTAVAHALHPWSVFFGLLVVFFLAGTSATKVKKEVKARLTHSSTGGLGGEGRRTHVQVLANSLVATALILLHLRAHFLARPPTAGTGDSPLSSAVDGGSCYPRGRSVEDLLVVGVVANYAAVAADTLSSELGILSPSAPRLITAPWRPVPRGTNGGVTLTGLLAGLAGAALLSSTATLLLPFCPASAPAHGWTPTHRAYFAAATTAAGFAGTLLDSLLGALAQASVVDARTGKVVEGEGGGRVRVRGAGRPFGQALGEKGRAAAAAAEEEERAREKEARGAAGRRVEVGRDLLDNNAVNLVMAGSVSLGAMGVAKVLWGL